MTLFPLSSLSFVCAAAFLCLSPSALLAVEQDRMVRSGPIWGIHHLLRVRPVSGAWPGPRSRHEAVLGPDF